MKKLFLTFCFLPLILSISTAQCLQLDIQTDVVCSDSNSGTASITPLNGTPPYQYFWGGNDTSNGGIIINDLASGTYSLTVTDANDCVADTIFIIEESTLTLEIQAPDVIACNGDCVTVAPFVTGGCAPYIYQWSDGSLGDIVQVCQPGVYSLTITDCNGCTMTSDFVMTLLEPLQVAGNVNPTSNCFGACDGSIDVTIFGGSGPYTVEWFDGDGNIIQEPIDLCPDQYTVNVIDVNGCFESIIFDLTCPLNVESVSITDATCFGNCDGSATIEVTGGASPYIYSTEINGSVISTTNPINNICAGTYITTIQDISGQITTTTFTIIEPEELLISLDGTDETCLDEGSITASATGGILPYQYVWSNGGMTETISDLVGGEYTVTVVDANNCVTFANYTIGSPIDLVVSSTYTSCDTEDGTATATVVNGAATPVFAWSNNGSGDTQTGLAPGGYSVTVTDTDTGCATHENILVEEDPSCIVTISGYVYNDTETIDCTIDPTTEPVQNVMVTLSNGDITFTDADGYYQFVTDAPGTYVVDLEFTNSQFELLCAAPISVDVPNFGMESTDNNFFLEYNPQNDLCLSFYRNNARPGFFQTVNIYVYNYGNEPMSGMASLIHDPIQEYTGASPMETTYDFNTSTVSWDFVDLEPGDYLLFSSSLYLDPSVMIGTELMHSYNVTPVDGDINPDNNTAESDFLVTGSYDPNDKQVTPRGLGETGIIDPSTEKLSYQIRFQNTGTDTAFTVVIRDVIDEDLDLMTIVPGASSHDYRLDVINGNELEFTFDNIMLPDSNINEPASHGYVLFEARLKENLPIGTEIENTAAIYFDFNAPIITNTVLSTLDLLESTNPIENNLLQLQVVPNPIMEESTIHYYLPNQQIVTLTLYDINGRIVEQLFEQNQQIAGLHQVSFGKKYKAGTYFLQLQTTEGYQTVQKVIKLK